MMIGETLMAAQTQLAPVSESPRLDAELLLSHVTGFSRSQILMHLRDPLAAKEQGEFDALIARRLRREPVAYLTGEKGFWTLNLKVGPAVLVPRPETELLVEWALNIVDASFPHRRESRIRIADLGTGSGCIALALACELPQAEMLAVDISNAALEIAQENAKTNGIGNVQFLQASFSEALDSRPRGNDGLFDLIVSNPPYIARGDAHLEALQHEPLMALTDGADGLHAIREIIAGAPAHLQPGAWLLIEHGYDQGEAVRGLFMQNGFTQVETRRDLAGHERATGARCTHGAVS